ncbi:hypothetical protein BV22DRAFT_1039504 [Leucogyrophana mollusca]|uniref:Uncharacterized protein n=1 Tax=Leucogyrophana mollusca TaxID=85980 RepID=A0ACB8B591_9AGAM|nr:hypothetical protein BV22DRAFT_1039504 [Leucogyrophana mollusca]
MQAILVVRVYALYDRSKKLLAFLLACFCCEAIVMLVTSGTLFNFSAIGRFGASKCLTRVSTLGSVIVGAVVAMGPNSQGSVDEEATLDYSAFEPLIVIYVMMQVTFNMILLAFALVAAVGHAREARRQHGTWSINPLVKALVADHMIYFIVQVLWQAMLIPMILPNIIPTESLELDGIISFFNAFAVSAGPRMVISLRGQELKTVEGTSYGELSTIQFGAKDPPSLSVEERESQIP